MASIPTEIDKNSDTWHAVTKWAEGQRGEAVKSLISDVESDKQRGKIELIDELFGLIDTADEPLIVADTYTE